MPSNLQPDIALGVKPLEPIDFTKWAKLSNLNVQNEAMLQEIETAKAARPGIEADSAVKQRALGFNRWMSENGGKFIKQDGTVDHPALVRSASGVGYSNEARTIAKQDIERAGLAITNAKSQIEVDNAKLTQGLKTLAYGGHFFSNLPEKDQGKHLKETVWQLNNMAPGTGDTFASVVVLTDPSGKQIIDDAGNPKIDKAKVTALRLSGMTPETQETLAQAGSSNNTDAESRDAKSDKSIAQAKAAIDAGVPNVQVGKTSAAVLNNDKLFQELVKGAVIPAEYKAEGANAVDKLKADANSMSTVAGYIEELVKSGDLPKGNKVASIFGMTIDRVKNKAAFAAAKALLTDLTPRYPSINLETGDGTSVAMALRALHINTMNSAGQMAKRTRVPTFNQLDANTPSNAPVTSNKIVSQAPQNAIDALLKDPSLRPQFEARYGYLP